MLNEAAASDDLDDFLKVVGIDRKSLYWVHPRAGGELRRQVVDTLHANLGVRNPLMQILLGPRQVGKTTAAKHLLKEWVDDTHYALASSFVGKSGRFPIGRSMSSCSGIKPKKEISELFCLGLAP